MALLERIPVKTISGTSYSITPSDEGHRLIFTNGSAVTVTVAPGAWLIGAWLLVEQYGAGKVTLSASGTTIHNPTGTACSAQYATIRLDYDSTNVWTLSGSTGA